MEKKGHAIRQKENDASRDLAVCEDALAADRLPIGDYSCRAVPERQAEAAIRFR
jgi:hypothetical protein